MLTIFLYQFDAHNVILSLNVYIKTTDFFSPCLSVLFLTGGRNNNANLLLGFQTSTGHIFDDLEA